MSTRTLALLLALLAGACASTESNLAPDSTVEEFAKPNNPIVKARLQARIENIKYQRGVTLLSNLERIAGYGEVAIPYCADGLASEDPMTRMGCAWVLGRLGDTRSVPALEAALQDEVAFVRYEAASQLGTMGSRAGYRVLVEGLSDERLEYRYKCFEALRELTGKTFGYSHNAQVEMRRVAVEKWQNWLAQVESEEL